MCVQMLKHAIAHKGCEYTVRESGRKIPCHTGELMLPQQHAGPTLYQLSYIPTLQACRQFMARVILSISCKHQGRIHQSYL